MNYVEYNKNKNALPWREDLLKAAKYSVGTLTGK